MYLYLLRHAPALDVGEPGVETDEDRPLSEEGRGRVIRLAEALKRVGVTFDQILTSPLRRSRETVEVLVPLLAGPIPPVTVVEALSPGVSTKKLIKTLLGYEGESILLVGHEPDLSKHMAGLIGSKDAQIHFAKAALACLRVDGLPEKGGATLEWLVPPKWVG